MLIDSFDADFAGNMKYINGEKYYGSIMDIL